jgi:hypothetical protein
MKAKIFIMEDNGFYFDIIKEVLENISLTFYPNSKDDFCKLRRLLVTCTDDNCLDSIKKEASHKILEILKDNTDKETTFLITCCLGENQEPTLEGLVLYKMFTKDYGKKTVIISSTTLSREIKTIENFCEKELNCVLFEKSEKSLRESLEKYL